MRAPAYKATFHGFVRTVKGQQRYAPFKFGNAQSAERQPVAAEDAAGPAKTGLVSVSFYVARPAGPQTATRISDSHATGRGGLKEGRFPWFVPDCTTLMSVPPVGLITK